jgi:hypothetical protein
LQQHQPYQQAEGSIADMGRLRGHGKLPVTAEVVAKETKGSRNGAARVSLISAMMRYVAAAVVGPVEQVLQTRTVTHKARLDAGRRGLWMSY